MHGRCSWLPQRRSCPHHVPHPALRAGTLSGRRTWLRSSPTSRGAKGGTWFSSPPPSEFHIWFALISSIVLIRISRRRAAATAFVSLAMFPGCGRAGARLAQGCRPRPCIQPSPCPAAWEQRPAHPCCSGAGLGLERWDNPRQAGLAVRERSQCSVLLLAEMLVTLSASAQKRPCRRAGGERGPGSQGKKGEKTGIQHHLCCPRLSPGELGKGRSVGAIPVHLGTVPSCHERALLRGPVERHQLPCAEPGLLSPTEGSWSFISQGRIQQYI